MSEAKPLVSICCNTHNHIQFIRKCLDGFVLQKPPTCIISSLSEANHSIIPADWLEILIHDDASTDGTADVIREYEAKYPDVIKPIYETENQFSKVGHAGIDLFNYKRVQGKYVAYCEGDDYWTDPLKLQKQVDWMEAHPDYTLTCHCYQNYNVPQDKFYESDAAMLIRRKGGVDAKGVDLSLDEYFERWYTMPLTMVFRMDAMDLHWREQYKYYRDQHENYHLIKAGKCYIFAWDGAVRNMHENGEASLIPTNEKIRLGLAVADELYKVNRDTTTKKNYVYTLIWASQYTQPLSIERIRYAHRIWKLNHNIMEWLKIMKRK